MVGPHDSAFDNLDAVVNRATRIQRPHHQFPDPALRPTAELFSETLIQVAP